MKKFVVAFALAAAVVATPAAAQPFKGSYGGIAATLDNVALSGEFEGFGISGAGATVFVGHDFDLGAVSLGVELNADLNTADINDLDVKAKWGHGVSARLGVPLNDATGIYGRVGYQRNKVSLGGDSAWGDGVKVGAGLETKVSSSAWLRAEFNHTNYEADLVNNQAQVGVAFRF